MWYISFQGEGDGGVNNILVYHKSGKEHKNPQLLPEGDGNPELNELRCFAIVGDLLYIANSNKDLSQILVYQSDKKGDYSFYEVFATGKKKDPNRINSILHPYDFTFDSQGNCYISSQDTNVVTRLHGANNPLDVACYLQQQYPTGTFLTGTFVASSIGALPHVKPPTPPDVPLPQGLDVSFKDDTNSKVANSVRGVLFYDGYLYVSDEPANAVKVYDGKTGQLYGVIAGDNLSAPIQLLLNETTKVLYIGSSDNASVVSYDLSGGAPSKTVAPETFINGHAKHVSGMAFDDEGHFYVAERVAKKIKKFPSDGSGKGNNFITDLPDEPEFILYVPKSR